MVAKRILCILFSIISYNLAKILMVAKLRSAMQLLTKSYNLAKILMVAKLCQ